MAITHVQSVFKNQVGGASATTAAIATTTGNLIVGSLLYNSGFTSFTDSVGLTWSSAVAEITQNVNEHLQQVYNDNITGNASHTFTLSLDLTTSRLYTFTVHEISGQVSGAALDKTATVIDGSAITSHVTANTATTAQANEMLIGFGGMGNVACTLAAGGTWTQDQEIDNNPGTSIEGGVFAHKAVSATGAQNFDWTTSAGIRNLGAISTWKEAAAGGGPATAGILLVPGNMRGNLGNLSGGFMQ